MTSNFESMHPSLAPSLEALQADTAQLKAENDLLREMATNFDDYATTATANVASAPAMAAKSATHEAATTTPETPTITLPTPTISNNQSRPSANISLSNKNKLPRRLTATLLAMAAGLGVVACGASSSSHNHKSPAKDPKGPSKQLSSRVERDATVAEAVKDSHVTGKTLDADIRAGSAEAPKQVDNNKDAMDSILPKFAVGHVTSSEAALAAAYGVKGSDALLAMVYDGMHHDPNGKVLPEAVSRDHALKYVEDEMLAEGTTHSVWTPAAGTTYLNHGTAPGAEQAFDAGIVTLNGDEQVYTMHLANGSQVTFKLFDNNCMNVLTPVTITVPEHLSHILPSMPTTPETPTPRPHKPPHHPHHHHHHHKHPSQPPVVTPPGGTPPVQQPPFRPVKVALPPPGPNHADRSPGTPSEQSPVYQQPGPGPDATPPQTTTTAAPVNEGSSNGDSTASTPDQSQSTQPTPNGGVTGQGGSVNPNSVAASSN